jgi:cyclopropane fatty-acyl-phospholipid synthase-like methyltransferase
MAEERLHAPICDDRRLQEAWLSQFSFPALTVADEIGLFPLIHSQAMDIQEVATRLSIATRAAEALLGLLASLGFLARHGGKYRITDLSREFLLPESPYYWGGILKQFRELPMTYDMLLAAVRKNSFTMYGDQDTWEAHEQSVERAEAFTAAMHSISFAAATALARVFDFNGVRSLLDVAGGAGSFCIALARHYPGTQLTVMELPTVCPITEKYVARYELRDRINVVRGNMFKDDFPKGHDAILFSQIFHDWNEEQCRILASKSFAALPSGGRIFIHEILLDDTRDGPAVAAAFSLCMLWGTQGKQYTLEELTRILEPAGFVGISATHTYGYYSVVTATKP